jgi:hypothetical protein
MKPCRFIVKKTARAIYCKIWLDDSDEVVWMYVDIFPEGKAVLAMSAREEETDGLREFQTKNWIRAESIEAVLSHKDMNDKLAQNILHYFI